MNFDYKRFKKKVAQKYGGILDEAVINKVLDLGDENDYSRDNPISTGKKLTLIDLILKGKKSNGEEINFFQEFKPGVNIIIADNFKGKSSVFKAIQFALTGNDHLKHDIKKWLNAILLNFRINEQDYCVCLNTESNILDGSLYSTRISSLEEIESLRISPLFQKKGVENFTKEIELFFFSQFSYYSLKWTQKSSKKDSNELVEANASWKTYFKSIFLESRDTNLVYGSQEKKIFQMLLGLQLTYPINRLTIKKDMKESEKARISDSNKFKEETGGINKKALEDKIVDLDIQIQRLRRPTEDGIDLATHSQQYELIVRQIAQGNEAYLRRQSELRESYRQLYLIEDELRRIKQDLTKIQSNILQITRSIQDLQEFLDIGRLFSNLEIKYCPCCNKKVSGLPIASNSSEVECILCHEMVDSIEGGESQLKYLEKIDKLNQDKQKSLEVESELLVSLKDVQQKEQIQKIQIDRLKSNSNNNAFSLVTLQEDLAKIEAILGQQQHNLLANNEQLESFIYQKAIAEFQLQQPSIEIACVYDDSLENQISMLEFAINLLKQERYNLGKNVLNDLSNLMLEELHLFGLTTITAIQISENFDIYYKQDGDLVQFDRIAEGEQLRVKISLYLSLIQLDIKYNFGKHTRFLILDSPSKEEGDSVYLEGLSTLLRSIEDRFKNELQIFIGTAERKLAGIVTNEILLEDGDFLF
jgi:hypothetical protein